MFSLSLFQGSRSESSSVTGSANKLKDHFNTPKEDLMGSMKSGHTFSSHGLKTSDLPISQMPEIKQMVVLTAVKRLFDNSYFSVCELTSIADVIGVKKKGPAWDLLRAIHCVDFNKMPAELRDSIPHLVNECLTAGNKSNQNTLIALDGVVI